MQAFGCRSSTLSSHLNLRTTTFIMYYDFHFIAKETGEKQKLKSHRTLLM